jgi:hypothetical protein
MEWSEASNDQIDVALDRFAGLSSAGQLDDWSTFRL